MKITVLVTGRRNSKYMAKFLNDLAVYTNEPKNLDVRVMLNSEDNWNHSALASHDNSGVFGKLNWNHEGTGIGRAGLHLYFNKLLEVLSNEDDAWVVYFCDDHKVIQDWDKKLEAFVEEEDLDPREVNAIIPKFDNAGAMNHILSAAMVSALGRKVGSHGWIDSYLNEVFQELPNEVVHRMDEPIFHDFTHDKTNPMTEEHCQLETTKPDKSINTIDYGDPEVKRMIQRDARMIKKAVSYHSIITPKKGGNND